MNVADFDRIIQHRHNHRMDLLNSKASEYARKGDRLWNFKRIAGKRDISQVEACQNLMDKQDVSIADIIDRAVNEGLLPTQEFIDEKFSDIHNYYDLLEANLMEYLSKDIPL